MAARVLVPYDDSAPAREALERAFELFSDGEFLVVTVSDASSVSYIPDAPDESLVDDEVEDLLGEGLEELDSALDLAEAHGRRVETEVRIGSSAQEILESAEENDVDHVVMGSDGHSGVTRLLLGSVAEVVVRHSPVPVTVVR
ncbi:universal stress protein [Natrialbaceae archaeon GCM10025810]|uniref:universal stress protein n=1 Tax=Halovalidus salilacus TaxID=3075124 RepID=UPI00360A3A98